MLLLLLRGAAVLPLRGAAERGAAAGTGALRAGGRARVGVRGAVPGAGRGRARAAAARAAGCAAARPGRAHTDPLDTFHASSECARFKVIVLRSCASPLRVSRSSDCDQNFY